MMLEYAIELLYVAAVVGGAQLIQNCFSVRREVVRKIVHILICFVWVFQYYFFTDGVGFVSPRIVVVPAVVTLLLFFTARYRLVPSFVNEDNPYGIFYYAAAITGVSLLSWLLPATLTPGGLSIFCLSFGDGAAALFGMCLPRTHRLYRKKTWEGTLACFAFAALGMCLLQIMVPYTAEVWVILFLAALSAVLELFSGKYDNPAIVFGVSAAAALLL